MVRIAKLSMVIVLLWSAEIAAQVGINTTAPLSTLDINGNLSVKTIGIPVPLNGGTPFNATPINDGVYISLTPTVGATEFLLPDPVAVPGRIYILRNISDTVTATLYISAPRKFFSKGSNTGSTDYGPIFMPPNAAGKTMIVVSDGANWTYFD